MRPFVIALVLALAILAGIAAQGAKAPAAPVNINRASLLELMQLPGVGPSRAEAIVQHRNQHPFRRTADLLRIKGLGRHTFIRLKPFVTVEVPAPPAATSAPEPAAPNP